MKSPQRYFWWAALNALLLLLVPLLFGIWLQAEIDHQYSTGARTAEQGDALLIPVFGVALLTGIALIAVNLILGLLALVRRLRRRTAR